MKREFPIERHPESFFQVPNIAHFLWIGSGIPAKYVKNINNFASHNNEYQVILWQDVKKTPGKLSDKVEVRHVSSVLRENLQVKAIFEQLEGVGARSDLLKYQIVFKFGGIYLDTDTVSIQPLGNRLKQSFVAYRLSPYFNIQSSIFGFAKSSRFLQFVLAAAKLHFASPDFQKLSVPEQFGPTFFTTSFVCIISGRCMQQ